MLSLSAGRWTSYGEVAVVAGTYPQPVAAVIASYPMANAWRVLQAGGTISAGFRWNDAGRTDDPKTYLESEGLEFDDAGHASRAQFIAAAQLAELTGLEVDDDAPAWQSSGAGGLSPLKSQQWDFFQRVRDLAVETGTLIHSWPKPQPQHWMDVSIGSGRAYLSLTLNSVSSEVGCALYIPNDKHLFANLLAKKGEIEAAVGASLDWRELPTKKASRIVLLEPGDFRDEDEAPRLARWLLETAERFAEVFPTYL